MVQPSCHQPQTASCRHGGNDRGSKPFSCRDAEIAKLVKRIGQAAVIAPGQRRVRVIKDDPSDDHVLSAALEAEAEYIVTGDRHLLALGSYRGIKIVQPHEFLALLG